MSYRFILIILLNLILIAELSSQQYWIEQPCPTTKYLTRITYSDSMNIWASGDSGAVIYTSNGGQNWSVQQTGITSLIEDFLFLNSRLGWAVSNDFFFTGTIILKTTNGGLNWTNSRFPDTTQVFRSIYFIDSLNGFLGGYGSTIMKTTNAGVSYTRCHIDSNICFNFPVLRFNFVNSLTGYAVGGVMDQAGIFWKTTDGGLNWTDSCIAAEPLWDIVELNSSTILATGGDFEYGASNYTSTDGGITWRPLTLQIFGVPQRIAKRTANEFWIPCGSSEKFGVSIDNAQTWFAVSLPDTFRVYDTRFITPYSGWSIGCKGGSCRGLLLKYNTGVIGLNSEQTSVPVEPMLYQNYPNPFNPSTSIKYYLPFQGQAELNIYDALGKLVKTADSGFKKSGEYKVSFDASGLSSGIYFYEIKILSGDKTYTLNKKMVFLK